MGNLNPGQMFDHNLDVVKGPSKMHRLDYAAPVKAGETINEGSVMSVDSSGKFIAGCPAGGATIRPMPIFAIQNVNDFDANSDIGNMSGGVMSGVVATGGFEIKTTEYDATGTYLPNQLLQADGTTGNVTEATAEDGTEAIVGCVTKAPAVNAEGKSVLSFWTMFVPATA